MIRTIYPVGLAALLAGTLAAVPAAASTAGLHVVASPFISNSSLGGAAVIAPGDMWAVGAIGTGPFQPLAEHFNGTGWSVVPTPALSGALGRVAGAAGNDVWAVGDQAQGSSVNTLIEHWDGTRWSVVPSPKLPKGSQLGGVTAPATDNAWAVGLAGGSPDALVEHWDGTRWSVVSSPAFTGVSIDAISADSSTDVWAMGSLATGTTTENVSLHWDGTSWTQIPAAHLRFGGVTAITALSPANVWAVGTGPGVPTGGFSAHPTAVIEHWNGTSWNVVPSPNPNPQGNNSLIAVAAVSASDIWAMGLQLQGPFTEHWDGTSWSIITTPGGIRFIGGMAAASSGNVLAVGQGFNQSGIILSN
ncbi:MAG TPA: hypothetical protein VGA04_15340 [Streptosporangiaceae bacterium]